MDDQGRRQCYAMTIEDIGKLALVGLRRHCRIQDVGSSTDGGDYHPSMSEEAIGEALRQLRETN